MQDGREEPPAARTNPLPLLPCSPPPPSQTHPHTHTHTRSHQLQFPTSSAPPPSLEQWSPWRRSRRPSLPAAAPSSRHRRPSRRRLSTAASSGRPRTARATRTRRRPRSRYVPCLSLALCRAVEEGQQRGLESDASERRPLALSTGLARGADDASRLATGMPPPPHRSLADLSRTLALSDCVGQEAEEGRPPAGRQAQDGDRELGRGRCRGRRRSAAAAVGCPWRSSPGALGRPLSPLAHSNASQRI
jgi:hypothetical protein